MTGEIAKQVLRRLRPVAVNLSLVVGSLGVALLVAEVAMRVLAPQQLILIRPDLWAPADTVGWLHRPNVSTHINTGERTVSVFTDSAGFRVGSGGGVTGESEILLLGDSFMEALQVEYDQSGSGLLEGLISEAIGSEVAVRNAAIGGWDPDQYLLRARSLLAQREYDLVITAIYLGNDVISARREYLPPRAPVERFHLRLPRGMSGTEITNALLRPINDFLEVRSHLFVALKNRLQTVRMEVGLAAVPFPAPFLTSEAESERWEITADLCADISRLAAQHQSEALFVLVPAEFQVDSTDLTRNVQGFDLDPSAIDLEQPNRELGERMAARGLLVLDALPAFRAAHREGRRLYGTVDHHFSPEGHELFATVVAPVATGLLLDRRRGTAEPPLPTSR